MCGQLVKIIKKLISSQQDCPPLCVLGMEKNKEKKIFLSHSDSP